MDLPGPKNDGRGRHRKVETELQMAFCREYVIDWCGKAAAVRAGYSEKTARIQASELLSQPNIRAEIKRIVDDYVGDQRDEVRARVVAALKTIGLEKVNPPIPLMHKLKALELLGKFAVLFVDKIEHTGAIDPVHDMTPEERRALIEKLLVKRNAD